MNDCLPRSGFGESSVETILASPTLAGMVMRDAATGVLAASITGLLPFGAREVATERMARTICIESCLRSRLMKAWRMPQLIYFTLRIID